MSGLGRQRSRLLRTLRGHPEVTGLTITGHLTRAVDRVVIGALEATLARRPVAGAPPGALPRGWALVALGGYGRCRMSLRSDVDLQLIPSPGAPGLDALMGDLMAAIQGAGLKPGHGVRTVTESLVLAHEEITYATAVLGIRHLAGDPAVAPRLYERVRRHLAGPGLAWLLQELEAGRAHRARRQGGTTNVLEPDLKAGVGGLRDGQIVTWLSELLDGPGSPAVLAAEDTLLKVRMALHASASFNTNRLTFEYQDAVAEILAPAFRVAPGPKATRRLMQRVHLATRVLARHAERRLELATELLHPAGAEIRVAVGDFPAMVTRAGRLARAADAPIASSAEVVTAVCALMAADVPPEARLADALEAYARAHRYGLDDDDELRALVLHVMTDPRSGATRALHLLHQTGLIARIIPEFKGVMGLSQRDLYHVFTVDEHSLRVVDHLKALTRGERAEQHPLAADLIRARPRPRVLYLAGLLHDIGKGRGGNHHVAGLALADAVAARLGLSEAERALLAKLVRHQSALALTAARRDLSDIRPIRAAARLVGDRDTLDALYLLTVADWSSVGPEAFRDWQRALLDELYRRVAALLSDPAGYDDPSGVTHERLEALLVAELGALPSAPGAESDRIEDFCAELPTRYFRTFDALASAGHLHLWQAYSTAQQAPVVEVAAPEPASGVAVVTVVTADRPGLLSALTGGLAAAGFDVLSAHIYSLTTAVLDVFRVTDPRGRLASEAGREALGAALVAALEDPATVTRRLAERQAAAELMDALPAVAPRVRATNEAATHHTVIDVRAGDRTGLLHHLAGFLHERGLTVAQAFVATEGRVAHDSFYVVDAAGAMLDDDDATTLAAALERWLLT